MPFQTVVLYPDVEDLRFDMAYWREKHMPLVQNKFGQYGLMGYEMTKFDQNENGSAPAYFLQVTLFWKTQGSMKMAMQSPDVAIVFGDLVNFCNTQPISMSGHATRSIQ